MMDRLRTKIRLAMRLVAFVAATVGCFLLLELESMVRRRTPRIDLVNKWVSCWASILLRIFHVHVHAAGPYVSEGKLYPGAAKDGIGRIFVANHRSGVDVPVLFTLAAAHAISRHDLATWPLLGLGARRVGTLFVDRQSRRSGADVLLQVDKSLHAGEGVGMFPEGTVFEGDEVRPFRPGAFKAAQRAGAEIVPIGIAYGAAEAAFQSASFMQHMQRIGSLRRLDVSVDVGEPISLPDLEPVQTKRLAHERVQELVNRARQRLNEQTP